MNGAGSLSRRELSTLAAIADWVVPGGSARLPMSASRSGSVDDLVAELARPRARVARLAVTTILLLIDVISLLRWGKTVGKLSAARRERYLEGWADNRWFLPRRMFHVIAALVYLHHYARPEVAASLGFDPAVILKLPLRLPEAGKKSEH